MDTPRPQPHPFSMPVEIGGFRLQRVLGAGGMATVYAALQTQPRRTVALKVMKAGVASERSLRRFKREVEILGKLHHPYIAQVYAAGMHDDGSPGGGVPYFAMEYVSEAKTLLEFVAARQLDLRDRLKLFVKICAAIEHGHRRKIIHRDLKPGNILIDAAGEPKIIDFGVAHAAEIDISAQTMHTEAGALVGTLQYMAPEQVHTQLQDLDARCDVYALGAVLYKMLTGKPALDLEALPVYEAVRVIREDMPRPPSEHKPELKGDLETIILKAMEKDRTRRYSNAGSLGRDLVRFLANKPINARRAGLAYRSALFARRNMLAIVAVIAVGFAIIVAVGIVVYDRAQLRDIERRNRLMEAPPASAEMPPPATAPVPAPSVIANGPFTLNGHVGGVTRMAVSPDGRMLASGGEDHLLILWDLAKHSVWRSLKVFDGPVRHVAFNDEGTELMASAADEPFVLISVRSGQIQQRIKPGASGIVSLALSAGSSFFASGWNDLALHVESITGRADAPLAFTIRSTTGVFSSAAFSPDGEWVAGATRSEIHLKSLIEDESRTPHAGLDNIIALHWLRAEDGTSRCVAVDENGQVAIGDCSKEAEERGWAVFAAADSVIDAAFSPDGTKLACASSKDVLIWNLALDPPQPLCPPLQIEFIPVAIALGPDGTWCALGDGDGKITVVPTNARH